MSTKKPTYKSEETKRLENWENKLIKQQENQFVKEKEFRLSVNERNRILNKALREKRSAQLRAESLEKLLKSDVDFKKIYKGVQAKKTVDVNRTDILISDMHYRGTIDDVAVKRFFKEQLSQLKTRKQLKQITKVRLAFLGDMIDGYIHKNQVKYDAPTQQVNQLTEHLLAFIDEVIAIVGAKNLEIAWVNEDNHGETRPFSTERGEFADDNHMYTIGRSLKRETVRNTKWNGVTFWKDIDGVIETNDFFYLHGDKPFAKSADRIRLRLGTDKNIAMGHWHTFKNSQHGDNYLIVAPTSSLAHEKYARDAGYQATSAAALWLKVNKGKVKSWEMVEIN